MYHYLHLLHHYQRVAWESGDNGCPEHNLIRPPSGRRKGRDTIKAGATRCHPHGLNASLLSAFNLSQESSSMRT